MDSAKAKEKKDYSISGLLEELEAEMARLEGLIQEAEEGKSRDGSDQSAA